MEYGGKVSYNSIAIEQVQIASHPGGLKIHPYVIEKNASTGTINKF